MDHRSGLHSLWPKLDLNEFHKGIGVFETTNRLNLTPLECPHYSEQHIFLIDSRIKELFGSNNKTALGLIGINWLTTGAKGELQDDEFGQGRPWFL
jgi:hypothetical protein